jgi:hypothetical protein
MAINKNHEFEDLNGIKCSIVEKSVKPERVAFLKELLQYNGYAVVVVPSPPPKATTPIVAKEGEQAAAPAVTPPETFTVGVSDVSFNPTNAIFGRSLRTKDGHVVTLAYWQQKEERSNDEVPYFE